MAASRCRRRQLSTGHPYAPVDRIGAGFFCEATLNTISTPNPEDRETRDRHRLARAILSMVLFAAGVYVVRNYVPALAWAVVLSIAIWPLYAKVRAKVALPLRAEAVPILFTVLVGAVFLLPFAVLAIEAIREFHGIVDYSHQVEQAGIPVPEALVRLPYGAAQASAWWNANLAHAGWLQDFLRQLDTSSNRELGRNIGRDAAHRAILFGFSLLTLFFLLRSGDGLLGQCANASGKLFGPHGEVLARQMIASVHGTVAGLVLVALGEGFLMGIVYVFTRLPHPVLFGALTAIAAIIPFAATLAIGGAALVAFANGGAVPALVIVIAGVFIAFSADHFVRPGLIGGATKLPFLWVLLGILGGVESFGLLGLFLGPAIMSALILIWRDLGSDKPMVASDTHSAGPGYP